MSKVGTECCFSVDGRDSAVLEMHSADENLNINGYINSDAKLVIRGSGLSYTGLSLVENGLALRLSSAYCPPELDQKSRTLKIGAGWRLLDIINFLGPSSSYILPVLPGCAEVTVGGAVACNVYGKNTYWAGNFCDHIDEMELLHPKLGRILVSREKNSEIFFLTCGGAGMTGLILNVRLRLHQRPGKSFWKETIVCTSLEDTYYRMMEEKNSGQQYLFTWNNLYSRNDKWGEGYIFKAYWRESLPTKKWPYLRPKLKPRHRPLHHGNLFNRLTIPILNSLYKAQYVRGSGSSETTYSSFSFPSADVSTYFKAFGFNGFIEKQVLIPHSNVEVFLKEFKKICFLWPLNLTLTSLKLGGGKPKHINFAGEGLIFSIDIPAATVRREEFIAEFDSLVSTLGGISNWSKDSSLSASVFSKQYGDRLDQFRRGLVKIGTDKCFSSLVMERLGL